MNENPLIKKLRINPEHKLAIINSPPGFISSLGDLPSGIVLDQGIKGEYDLIHAFFTHMSVLEVQIEKIKSALVDNGILWISYPKQSAKQDTDLNRDILRKALLKNHLKAVSLISID